MFAKRGPANELRALFDCNLFELQLTGKFVNYCEHALTTMQIGANIGMPIARVMQLPVAVMSTRGLPTDYWSRWLYDCAKLDTTRGRMYPPRAVTCCWFDANLMAFHLRAIDSLYISG